MRSRSKRAPEMNPQAPALNNPPSHPDSPKNPVTNITVDQKISFHIILLVAPATLKYQVKLNTH